MKKTLLIAAAIFMTASTTFAKDVVYLKGGSKIKGNITQITDGQLTLAMKRTSIVLTSNQVSWIKPDAENEILINALRASDPAKYEQGRLDASKYHQRAFGNAALGFLFGPFGFLGVAVGGAKAPDIMNVKDDALMKNEDYREGYKRKAKGKNIGNAALGWGSWVVLAVLAASL